MWATESKSASIRGEQAPALGVVKLLLDGQQRITTLYGVVRGRPPNFFEGNANTFSDLMFHLQDEKFEFYQPIKMKDDPLWVDVTDLMRKGNDGVGEIVEKLGATDKLGQYFGRLNRLLGILDINLHEEQIIGEDKSLDIVVDIFNRVNSGGTKLSKGDLALAKICADWPEARETMNQHLREWAKNGYDFNLDWLLRSVNTILTGEADTRWIGGAPTQFQVPVGADVPGGIDSEDEEAQIDALNNWVETLALPRGEVSFDYTDPETGTQLAVFDLAWPDGIQVGLTQPVAVLINEDRQTLRIAAKAGYKCFTREQDFRQYVSTEISPAGVVP